MELTFNWTAKVVFFCDTNKYEGKKIFFLIYFLVLPCLLQPCRDRIVVLRGDRNRFLVRSIELR